MMNEYLASSLSQELFFSACSFLDCAKGKECKNFFFPPACSFEDCAKGKDLKNDFFSAGPFLDCAKGKGLKNGFFCWFIFGLRKREGA